MSMGGQAPYCPDFPSSQLHWQIHCNPHQHPGRWFCRNGQTDCKVYLETQNPRSQNFHINPKKSFYPPRAFHTVKRQGDEAADRGERKTRTELPSLRSEKMRPNPPNAKSYLSSREQRSLTAASAIRTHSSIQFPSHIFTHIILDSVEPGRFVPGDPSLLQLSRCSFSWRSGCDLCARHLPHPRNLTLRRRTWSQVQGVLDCGFLVLKVVDGSGHGRLTAHFHPSAGFILCASVSASVKWA